MTRHSSQPTHWLVAIALLCAFSCRSAAAPVVPPSASASASRSSRATQEVRDLVPGSYEGPSVSIDVRPSAGGSQTIVNVMFPTGGWELRADSSTLRDGVAVARLTFVGPAADEMVTQALMQKPWTWPHKEPYKWIEVWVNVVRRGAQPRAPEYRLAARYPVAAMPAGAGGPARGAIPAQTSYRCGEEVFSITFAEGRASVTLGDKSVVTLERLKSDGASYEMRTFTNGRLTFVQELEHGKTARVRFARGRMVPTPCVRVE